MNCIVKKLGVIIDNQNLPIFENVDTIVSAYISKIGDNTFKTQITNYIQGLIDNNLWDKMIAIYPVLGGADKAGISIKNGGWELDLSSIAFDADKNYLSLSSALDYSAIQGRNMSVDDYSVFSSMKAGSSDIWAIGDFRVDLYNANNNSQSVIKDTYYSSVQQEMVTLTANFSDGINSWNANTNTVISFKDGVVYASKNGKTSINGASFAYDIVTKSIKPYFFTGQKKLHFFGIGKGLTMAETLKLEELNRTFIQAVGKWS